MSDDINEILKWSRLALHIALLVIMAIISIVALAKQRFWIPVFIHLLAFGGAIVTFLAIMTIPRSEPYSIIELLGRLFLFPGSVYGIYITLGGPFYINERMAKDKIIEHSPEELEQLHGKYDFIKKFPWFILSWLIFGIVSIIILIGPKDAETYNKSGFAWFKKGNFDQAIIDYNKALEINSKYEKAYTNRGRAWSEKGDFDKAIADYTKALELNNDDPNNYVDRGMVLMKKKEFKRALADFNNAIAIDSKHAWAYYFRGLNYMLMTQPEVGCTDLKRACALGALCQPYDDLTKEGHCD